ncbi:MAG: biotin transport system permease protein [Rhodobacteraceae bacterium HLUCCA12]|nr:MAG: biotin transport system permease protein [Rhodobacteraceae bacterium HLUCCA12]
MLAMTLEHRSWLHRVPAGAKMAAMTVAMVVLLPVSDPAIIAAAVAVTGALYATLGRIALARGARLLRPLLLVLALIMAWHLVTRSPAEGAVICLRILALVALANLVTLTTRLDDMTAVLEWVLHPLRRIGVNTAAISLALALVIRCIPVLSQKGAALLDAWRARSPRRTGYQIAVPLALLALDDAEHLADALRARGGVARPD